MSTSNFKEGKDLDLSNGDLVGGNIDAGASSYALLVLVLPCDPERKWLDDELDVVTAIAGQVIAAEPAPRQLKEVGIFCKRLRSAMLFMCGISDYSNDFRSFQQYLQFIFLRS